MLHQDDELSRLRQQNKMLKEKIQHLEQDLYIDPLGSEHSDISSVEACPHLSAITHSLQKPYDVNYSSNCTIAGAIGGIVKQEYKTLAEIGKGTFGSVYLIQTKISNETFALKVIKTDSGHIEREGNFVDFFMKNTHPNIIPFFAKYSILVNKHLHLHILMKHINHNFRYVLEKLASKRLIMKEHMHKKVCKQIVLGLEFLHTHNICHRDLKPENILLDSKMHVYLCDFGCAKVVPEGGAISQTYICSRFYRAPELIIDRNMYSCAIDMWSFGCIFIEACIGRILFTENTNLDMLVQHIKLLGSITQDDVNCMESSDPTKCSLPPFPSRNPQWVKLFNKRSFGENYESLCKELICFNPKKRSTAASVSKSAYWGLPSITTK